MNARVLSAQEAAVRSVGIPLRNFTKTIVFVNINYPSNRVHILKSKYELDQLDADSEDIFRQGLTDKYLVRPDNLEEMCLAEFASLYKVSKKRLANCSSSQASEFSQMSDVGTLEEVDENEWPKIIELKNGVGYMQKRLRHAVIRTHRFSFKKESEQYYYSMLMLYLPWRRETEDLLNGFDSAESHFDACKGCLLLLKNMNTFQVI